MDEEVAAKGARCVVVDAACAVSDVAHNEGFSSRAKLRENVGNCGCEEEEALGKLEGDALGARGSDAMDCLGDFEGVVLGEEVDGGEDFGVFEDRCGDLV
jgi:hypothetical protein